MQLEQVHEKAHENDDIFDARSFSASIGDIVKIHFTVIPQDQTALVEDSAARSPIFSGTSVP
jgi:hypothetical protein